MEKDRFIDIYRNLITKQTPLQMEEIIEFIDETIKIYSPKSKLDPNSIQVLLQTGLIEMVSMLVSMLLLKTLIYLIFLQFMYIITINY